MTDLNVSGSLVEVLHSGPASLEQRNTVVAVEVLRTVATGQSVQAVSMIAVEILRTVGPTTAPPPYSGAILLVGI